MLGKRLVGGGTSPGEAACGVRAGRRVGVGPISKLQVEPGEEGGRHKRWGEDITRAQAGSCDISLKAWDCLNMRSCYPVEEEAEGQTYLEATSDHFGMRQDRHLWFETEQHSTGRKV